MSITVTYSVLFEVKVLHHYFLNKGMVNFEKMSEEDKAEVMLKYDVREFLDITPTSECRKNLDRHHCIFKQTASGIIVGLKAELISQNPKKYKPFVLFDDDLTFTFLINMRDAGLLNYTGLPLTGNSGQVYLFHNRKSTLSRFFPSLHSAPSGYKAGVEYLPGDMLCDDPSNPTKLFTAALKTTDDPSGSSDWLVENTSDGLPMSYINVGDRHPLVRQTLSYRVKTAGVEPNIVVKTASGTAVEVRSVILPGEFRTIQVDLRGLPEGLYTMHAESADQTYQDDLSFYLLRERQTPFAILRLTVKSDAPDYDMLDQQALMLSPAYTLRFRNRATYWRYVGKNFNAASVTDEPKPLTRFGIIENITVPDKNGNPAEDLPNPEVRMIKAEALTVPAEKKFYSEIHLH